MQQPAGSEICPTHEEYPSIVHYRMEKAETNASCGGKNGKK